MYWLICAFSSLIIRIRNLQPPLFSQQQNERQKVPLQLRSQQGLFHQSIHICEIQVTFEDSLPCSSKLLRCSIVPPIFATPVCRYHSPVAGSACLFFSSSLRDGSARIASLSAWIPCRTFTQKVLQCRLYVRKLGSMILSLGPAFFLHSLNALALQMKRMQCRMEARRKAVSQPPRGCNIKQAF